MRLDKLDQERIVLDVDAARQTIDSARPFAALRSMFVTEGNSDVALAGLAAQERRRRGCVRR